MSLNLTSNFIEFNFEVAKGSKHRSYRFEEFRLDAENLMLYRGDCEVSLPPKAVETLLVLIENRGTIITKNELMDRVWSDAIVEESNLSQYLYRLRKTLGTRTDGQPFIETYRRRGYRFNGVVRVWEDEHPGVQFPSDTTVRSNDVERQGNVLKFADRNEDVTAPREPLNRIETANTTVPKRAIATTAVLGIAAVLLTAVAAAFYYRPESSSSAEVSFGTRHELTLTRLTNGAAPVDATISPKGDYFVYHEQDGDLAHLFLQQTGESSRIEISHPINKMLGEKTVTQDGGHVYFLASGIDISHASLYRVPTLGGTPIKLLDRIDSPVSFSPDGEEMVFVRNESGTGESTLIVANSNGENERVLLTHTKELGLLGYPSWSPDGQTIAYSVLLRESFEIRRIDVRSQGTELFSPDRWTTVYRKMWTRDGSGLVFIGTRLGEGLSTKRDTLFYLSVKTGEAYRISSDGNRYQIASLGMTDRDEVIAVPFSRSSQIWQVNVNGDSRTAVQITKGQADGRPGLATMPDGRLVYIARSGENLSVFIAEPDGSRPRQLTYDPPHVEEVRVSPDGTYLVFAATIGKRSHLFRIDPDGSNIKQLTGANTTQAYSAISPDGESIVFDSYDYDAADIRRRLLRMSSNGGEPVVLADIDCHTPDVSPDGRFISCIAEGRIVVVNSQTGEVMKRFDTVKVAFFNPGAKWSPDGRDLVYVARRKDFSNLWRQPIDGGPPQQLTDFTSGELHNFAFSPDGTLLYVARGYEVRDAMLIAGFR